MEVIVEQLGTTNNVLERQKFDQHRVELGRAFSNDVILTDEHVDAVHARLEFDEEGRLFIEDLDSVNGIRRPRHKAHIQRDEVHSGEVFLIGRSRVRIFVASHPVPPAVRIRLSEVFLLWLGKPQVAVALALIFMLTRVLGTWLTTLGEFRWSLVVERHFGETLMFLGLAIGVYFLSVLFRRGGNFLAHVSVLILLFLFSTVLELFLSLAEFNAGDGGYPMLRWLRDASDYIELFVYLWSILYLAFHISLGRRTLISAGIVAVVLGVNNLPDDEISLFIQQQSYPLNSTFLPPALLLKPVPDEQRFQRDLDSLYSEVEDKRVEALRTREERELEKRRMNGDHDTDTENTTPDEGPAAGEETGSGDAERSAADAGATGDQAPSSDEIAEPDAPAAEGGTEAERADTATEAAGDEKSH